MRRSFVVFSGIHYTLSFFLVLAGISKVADFGAFYHGFLLTPKVPPSVALVLASLVPAIEISAGTTAIFLGRRLSPSTLLLLVYLCILAYAAVHARVAPDEVCRCISSKWTWLEKITNSKGLVALGKAGALAFLALCSWLHLRRTRATQRKSEAFAPTGATNQT